jgi:methylmalonyl-CoA mutase N-terminal domain/subunit
MDETLGLPTEQAVTVALRTQQILAHETGVTRTVDPLGGSWFIEQLTDTMEREALAIIDEIDRMGDYKDWKPASSRGGASDGALVEHEAYEARRTYGRAAVAGINRGYFRRAIAEASYRFSEECEAGDRIIVGVNAYNEGADERPIDILTISHEVEVQQNERLKSFKSRRDEKAVAAALDRVRKACREGDPKAVEMGLNKFNVMPALVDGALANCTLGEMVQAMADVYGRYTGGPEW